MAFKWFYGSFFCCCQILKPLFFSILPWRIPLHNLSFFFYGVFGFQTWFTSGAKWTIFPLPTRFYQVWNRGCPNRKWNYGIWHRWRADVCQDDSCKQTSTLKWFSESGEKKINRSARIESKLLQVYSFCINEVNLIKKKRLNFDHMVSPVGRRKTSLSQEIIAR